jgi:hypothetical protein
MDDKTWGTTKTGTVFHSFKADGTAICRGSIRQPEGVGRPGPWLPQVRDLRRQGSGLP